MLTSRLRPGSTFALTLCLLVSGVLAPLPTNAQSTVFTADFEAAERAPAGAPSAVTPAAIGLSATNVFSLTADVEIRQAQPTTNLANELMIYVGYKDGHPSRMLLDLPLWRLPPGASVTNAVLRFHSGSYDYPGTERTLTAYRLTAPWQEYVVTWNKTPAAAEAVGAVNVNTGPRWNSLNLTGIVQAWRSGTYPQFGLMLVGPEGGESVYRAIASAETTNAPYLEISYTITLPTLRAAPTAATFLAAPSLAPLTSTITIHNPGSSPLAWTADTGGSNWIELSALTGTLGAGGIQTLNIKPVLTGLGYDTYSGQVQITSSTPGVVGSPQTIAVTLGYTASPLTAGLPLVMNSGPPLAAAALIIGISDYEHLEPEPVTGARAGAWGYDLVYAQNDAKQMGTILAGLERFKARSTERNIIVRTEAQATYAGILQAFQQLDALESESTVVFIHYSGHGGQFSGGTFLTAYDSHQAGANYVNIISESKLDQLLDELESQYIVVSLDSCYSGGMITTVGGQRRGLPPPDGTPKATAPVDLLLQAITAPNRVILTASTADQSSLEVDEFAHGVFTEFLMRALLNPAADSNSNGWVSAEEAYAYLAARVDEYVYQHTSPPIHQNPQLADGDPHKQVDLTRP